MTTQEQIYSLLNESFDLKPHLDQVTSYCEEITKMINGIKPSRKDRVKIALQELKLVNDAVCELCVAILKSTHQAKFGNNSQALELSQNHIKELKINLSTLEDALNAVRALELKRDLTVRRNYSGSDISTILDLLVRYKSLINATFMSVRAIKKA